MAARPSAARAGERGVVVDELAERGVRGPVVQRPELVPNSECDRVIQPPLSIVLHGESRMKYTKRRPNDPATHGCWCRGSVFGRSGRPVAPSTAQT